MYIPTKMIDNLLFDPLLHVISLKIIETTPQNGRLRIELLVRAINFKENNQPSLTTHGDIVDE